MGINDQHISGKLKSAKVNECGSMKVLDLDYDPDGRTIMGMSGVTHHHHPKIPFTISLFLTEGELQGIKTAIDIYFEAERRKSVRAAFDKQNQIPCRAFKGNPKACHSIKGSARNLYDLLGGCKDCPWWEAPK
jgi:hypothetical protein